MLNAVNKSVNAASHVIVKGSDIVVSSMDSLSNELTFWEAKRGIERKTSLVIAVHDNKLRDHESKQRLGDAKPLTEKQKEMIEYFNRLDI